MVLILGVDAGGTASKAVVTSADGTVVGRGTAGPGNPSAVGSAAAVAIGAAVRAALGTHDPRQVVAAVAGVAGTSKLGDPAVVAAFARQWAELGLTCPVRMLGDVVTALAAGQPADSGVVLLSGTGAIAALVEDATVTRTADGLGWLLGDEGSGLWLGLQAVRWTARHFTGGGLASAVAAHAGAGTADDLVHWAGRLQPAAFAALAPAVCALADDGDPVAAGIVDAAVRALIGTLDALDAPGRPIVLAGGVLTGDTPVRRGVLGALGERGITPGTAYDPALGAARLAARTAAHARAG